MMRYYLCLPFKSVCNELALCDVMEDKLKGECMDLRQGLPFMKNMKIGKNESYLKMF